MECSNCQLLTLSPQCVHNLLSFVGAARPCSMVHDERLEMQIWPIASARMQSLHAGTKRCQSHGVDTTADGQPCESNQCLFATILHIQRRHNAPTRRGPDTLWRPSFREGESSGFSTLQKSSDRSCLPLSLSLATAFLTIPSYAKPHRVHRGSL
jgi:hypothetical protein